MSPLAVVSSLRDRRLLWQLSSVALLGAGTWWAVAAAGVCERGAERFEVDASLLIEHLQRAKASWQPQRAAVERARWMEHADFELGREYGSWRTSAHSRVGLSLDYYVQRCYAAELQRGGAPEGLLRFDAIVAPTA